MQDPKNSSSIFSFSKTQRRFIKTVLVFFAPVVLLYILVEVMVLQIPFNYNATSDFFDLEKENIEIIALGPSQTNSAINPNYFDDSTISLASTAQHHNLDFKILSQLKDRMPNLKYVIFELSYSHLELPHNTKTFWKNSIYLKYYNVNAFERNTYFKDELIYLASPDIYSKHLIDHYLKGKEPYQLNRFGFKENDFEGRFKSLDYDEELIAEKSFQINSEENLRLFQHNTAFFYEMLEFTRDHDLKVIVCTMPLYKTYLERRNPAILRRRDSILKIIASKYPHVRVFEKETDTTMFKVQDYINENHLNPRGAAKFSKELNAFIKEQFDH